MIFIVGLALLIGFAIASNKPQRQRTLEEQSAYERRSGEIEAEKDHDQMEEERNRPISTGFESPLADIMLGNPKRKRKGKY